jgi:hypothetical protein
MHFMNPCEVAPLDLFVLALADVLLLLRLYYNPDESFLSLCAGLKQIWCILPN